jgi:hypothetical protein
MTINQNTQEHITDQTPDGSKVTLWVSPQKFGRRMLLRFTLTALIPLKKTTKRIYFCKSVASSEPGFCLVANPPIPTGAIFV